MKSADGVWRETPQTSKFRDIFTASVFLSETVFRTTGVVAVRLARAIRTLTHRKEFAGALSLWWTAHGSHQISFLHSESSRLTAIELVGQAWGDLRVLQLLTVPEHEDWVAEERWRLPMADAPQAASAAASEPSEAGARLSTIPEGEVESEAQSSAQSLVSWSELCDVFGDTIRSEHAEALACAYAACMTEIGAIPPVHHPTEVEALRQAVVDAAGPDVPEWSQVSEVLELPQLRDLDFFQAVAACNSDPLDYTVLDADDCGAYVAVEVHGDACKLVEGLNRLPNADEHVELRIYETHSRKAVIDRSDDVLTHEEVSANTAAIAQAMLDELKTWQGFKCFQRRPRAEAPCIIDARWVD